MESLFYASLCEVAQKASRLIGSIEKPKLVIGAFQESPEILITGLIDLSRNTTLRTVAILKESAIQADDFCAALKKLCPHWKSHMFVFINERTENPCVRKWLLWEPAQMRPRLICGKSVTHEYTFSHKIN